MKTFLVLALFAFNAFAYEFDGKWVGKGELEDSIGKADCVVTIEIKSSAKQIVIKTEEIRCAGSSSAEEIKRFDIVDDGLWLNNKRVGSFSDSDMILYQKIGTAENAKVYKAKADGMYFNSIWESRLSGRSTTTAILKKQP